MLHAMRRSAFFGDGEFTALLVAPVWFYLTYLNGTVQNLVQTINKIEGTGQQAQSQLNGFEQAWQQFEARFGFGSSTPQQ